jgi:hypothetical protein
MQVLELLAAGGDATSVALLTPYRGQVGASGLNYCLYCTKNCVAKESRATHMPHAEPSPAIALWTRPISNVGAELMHTCTSQPLVLLCIHVPPSPQVRTLEAMLRSPSSLGPALASALQEGRLEVFVSSVDG